MLARRASGVQAASAPNLALEFVYASTHYVDLGANNMVSGSDNRTLTAWIKPVFSDSVLPIMCIGSYSTGQAWRFRINGSVLRTEIQGSGYTSGLTVTENVWQFVACVLDGTTLGDHTIYLNGSSEGASGTSTVNTSTTNAKIGSYEATSSERFAGEMDDIRFYNAALSSTEIATLYNNRGAAVVQSNLVGWWKFDEGIADAAASGTDSVIDSSGNGNHGTPANSPYYRAV